MDSDMFDFFSSKGTPYPRERDDFSTMDHPNLSVKVYQTAAKNLSMGFFNNILHIS
jgi:hypothetical protein